MLSDRLPFILMAMACVAMAIISLIPGADGAYSSWPMIALWSAIAVSGLALILRRRLWRRIPVLMLHVALIVILAGALVTRLSAESATLRLLPGESATVATDTITLRSFEIVMYPGTQAPRDFVSAITVGGREYTVAMNHPAHAGRHTIFQSAYDPATGATVLTARSDAAGTAVTYAGYYLLAVAMIWHLLARRWGRFAVLAALALPLPAAAGTAATAAATAHTPRSISREAADALGNLFIYHHDRIMPLSTLARDFTVKVTGSTEYRGLSPEQFMSGWLFFYDDWRREPCFRIKGESERLSLIDFFAPDGTYRFADAAHSDANDKFSLVSEAVAGSLWRLYPAADSTGTRWLSPVDDTPPEMNLDDWRLVRHGLNYLAELAVHGRDTELAAAIAKIGRYQQARAGDALPSRTQVRAERAFLAMAGIPWTAVALLIAGIVLFIRYRRWPCIAVAAVGACWTVAMIVLSWTASGAVPLTDGPHTMLWLAAGTLIVALRPGQQSPLLVIIGALALCVALMGQSQPRVTQAVPVLRSPLLSIHVLCVTAAYAMLALMAGCGIAWLCGRRTLLRVARRMLEPAVFMLAAGIFIGAVWANQSWGRYWGWDPKEVWALITMLVYSLPLHTRSLPMFGRDRTYAVYCTAAFATVLITYFGVNYLLGGLHSYA